jgi:response regulator RpfG family c-di-GMP phosphodiesterase
MNIAKAMSESVIKILYVDDEVNNLLSFKATFRTEYHVLTAISAEEGRKILEKEKDVSIIISDQRMPNETGVQLFESIVRLYPDSMRVLLTGYTDIQAVIDAINKGQVYRYLTKPWNADELKSAITQAYEVHNLRKENQRLTEELQKVNYQLEFLYRQSLIS